MIHKKNPPKKLANPIAASTFSKKEVRQKFHQIAVTSLVVKFKFGKILITNRPPHQSVKHYGISHASECQINLFITTKFQVPMV